MDSVDYVFIFLLFVCVAVLFIFWQAGYFDSNNEAEIDYILYAKTVPSFYGLCGTKEVEVKASLDEWNRGVYDNQGYYLKYTKYK